MSEFGAIEDVVSLYLKGLHQCDIGLITEQFAPDANIRGYYEGELVNMKLPKYLNVLGRMSPPHIIGEEFDMKISCIDRVGKVANVRIDYLFQALNYVDYLSLLKIDGRWKIVSKVFHHD